MTIPVSAFLFVAVALLSTLGGILLWKRRIARRRDFLQGAAQYLGLQYLEGDAAWEQAQREQREEGIAPPPVPEFLERMVRNAVSPRLAGQFRGIRVSVYEEVHSSRSGSHTESVFKAYLPQPLPFQLELRREGAGARIAKAFGGQDVTTGDAAFDAAVRVKSGQPEQAAAFFRNAERQAAVLQALQAYPAARICRTHLSVSRQGGLRDEERIKQVLAALVKAAAAFAG